MLYVSAGSCGFYIFSEFQHKTFFILTLTILLIKKRGASGKVWKGMKTGGTVRKSFDNSGNVSIGISLKNN